MTQEQEYKFVCNALQFQAISNSRESLEDICKNCPCTEICSGKSLYLLGCIVEDDDVPF